MFLHYQPCALLLPNLIHLQKKRFGNCEKKNCKTKGSKQHFAEKTPFWNGITVRPAVKIMAPFQRLHAREVKLLWNLMGFHDQVQPSQKNIMELDSLIFHCKGKARKNKHDHQLRTFSDFFEFKFYINLYNLQVKEPSPPDCRCPSKLWLAMRIMKQHKEMLVGRIEDLHVLFCKNPNPGSHMRAHRPPVACCSLIESGQRRVKTAGQRQFQNSELESLFDHKAVYSYDSRSLASWTSKSRSWNWDGDDIRCFFFAAGQSLSDGKAYTMDEWMEWGLRAWRLKSMKWSWNIMITHLQSLHLFLNVNLTLSINDQQIQDSLWLCEAFFGPTAISHVLDASSLRRIVAMIILLRLGWGETGMKTSSR